MSGRNHNCSTTCQYSQVINIFLGYYFFDYKTLDLFEWKEKCDISRVNERTCKLMSKSRYQLFCFSDVTEFYLNVLRIHCCFADRSCIPSCSSYLLFLFWIDTEVPEVPLLNQELNSQLFNWVHSPVIFSTIEHLIFSWENNSKYSYTQLGV